MTKDVDGVCGGGRVELGSAAKDVCEGSGCDGWSSNGWMSSSGSGSEKSRWITSTCMGCCMPPRSGSSNTLISSVKQS